MAIHEAIQTIIEEFRSRYNAEVNIDLSVHFLLNEKKPSAELAEKIIREMAREIGGSRPRHCSTREAAWVETETKDTRMTVFYPTSYHEEGRNASICSPGTEEDADHAAV